MTARIGAFVVVGFAAVWLWIGARALPGPWPVIVGVIGVAVLLGVAWHILRRPAWVGRPRRFDRGRFAVAVAFEVIAANLAAGYLGRTGQIGYLWPALGIVVALHFIGLWWATEDRRYIALTGTMLAANVAALSFAAGSSGMSAMTGLGSSMALTVALL